jgi:UDP-N-acetylglucosamine--N-acetylmuramyl-(pentapeptide) pyrophosphoryl-undecaprenol N-acetylglucosamine transferase
MKKIAFTGGGTGGHIYPNLAIIEDLRANFPEFKLFYYGNPEKLEAKLLASDDITDFQEQAFKNYVEFIEVESEPLIKSINPFKIFAWIKRFNFYKKKALQALKEQNIDLVFGTGGFAAGPVFAAAKDLKIPYIIHNLDAHMGLANKAFVNDARALTLGVCDLGIKPKSKQVFITGNPISQKFLMSLKKEKTPDNKLHLLITGGSQGAQSINTAIGELLDEFKELDIEIVHITGKSNYQKHKELYLKPNPGKYEFYKVCDYTHEMPQLCAWADIAICRSGAMTVAEMLVSKTLAIYIPLPWAAHDHQTKNAQAISDLGVAITLDQDQEDLKESLLSIIKKACGDKNYLAEYKEKINALNLKDSNKEIIKVITDNLNLAV